MFIGEFYWCQLLVIEEIVQVCGVSLISDFLMLSGFVGVFDDFGYDVVEMVLVDQEGWDWYEVVKWLIMCCWLEVNFDDDFVVEVRVELNIVLKCYVIYVWECFGWGVFVFIVW